MGNFQRIEKQRAIMSPIEQVARGITWIELEYHHDTFPLDSTPTKSG
jgi:hypothetical protein